MEKLKQPKFTGLTKKFCKKCHRDSKKVPCWDGGDEDYWMIDHVFCLMTYTFISITKPPSINCPYHLEHMLNMKED